MKYYPAVVLIKIVLMMVFSSALTTSCLNSSQKSNDEKSILVSGRIQLPKNYQGGINFKHVLGSYVTYSNQDKAKQSTAFKVDGNGQFNFKVTNNSKIFLEAFYHDYFQLNVLKYYGEIKVPVNGGAINPIILEATHQSVKEAYDITGTLQFPKEYQGKVDTSNVAINLSILPHKNTNTYMAKADGSFKLGTCLTGPGKISINHYDPQSQKIFYGSMEFSKVSGKNLQTGPLKLQVKSPETFQKPISISGKFELPEGYRDEICPSQIEVTFINCPTFKRHHRQNYARVISFY